MYGHAKHTPFGSGSLADQCSLLENITMVDSILQGTFTSDPAANLI